MEELFRSNNPVLISLAESLLRQAGIKTLVADQHMSIMEGSLGILPKRLLVDREKLEEARQLLDEADIKP
jgi:hypothetical protein